MTISRRDLVRNTLAAAAALALPVPLRACARSQEEEPQAPARTELADAEPGDPDQLRLQEWVREVRASNAADPALPLGQTAAAVGVLAAGARTPYQAYTLEEYLKAGGGPARAEPLTLSLQQFDCVTLVESCLAIARVARRDGPATWEGFAREMERMRYRDGKREGYLSRLHYFSEWIDNSARRGLVRHMGEELGGVPDRRPLRFMSQHRDSYPALAHPEIYEKLQALERALDGSTRWVVPTERIPEVSDRIQTGDVLAFATAIEGLDVTHSAFAYRDEGGVLRVLHAPLSGGVVEVTRSTLPEYVRAIRRSTGILVARPLAT
jgi:hypothetical protein